MLRNKGLSEKVILLGLDGLDPKFSRKMVDEGHMPNLKKLIERGAARHDLRLLGAVPTITPPTWATLATGAYPMTHGIEDFNINLEGELGVNFSGIYSKYCKAEQLWNVTAEAGKKTLVWHWPGGSWPPSSDSENLYVVDGTSPGALGFTYAMRDWEGIAVASTKIEAPEFKGNAFCHTEGFSGDPAELLGLAPNHNSYTKCVNDLSYVDDLYNEFKEGIDGFNGFHPLKMMDIRTNILMPGDQQMYNLHHFPGNLALSPITEPTGWEVEIPEGAKEFTWMLVYGRFPHPCLILKNEQGVYDRVAVYLKKDQPQPVAIIEKDVYTKNVPDFMPNRRTGGIENIVRNVRILDLAEDGSFLRMWYSNGFSADDNSVWYPTWIFDKIKANFGPPCATGQLGDGDDDIVMKCNLEQWRQAAKWQADSLNYMIKEEGVEVIFSHFHGPDMAGHTYMRTLKEREGESRKGEETYYNYAIGTHEMADEYIGEFIHLLDEGWTILVFSDHSLICPKEDYMPEIGDNYGINIGLMKELGYTVLQKDENGNDIAAIDWEKTRAIQQRSNSIYINLKGRDRFGIVDPAEKYALEEQIITDLYGVKDPKTGRRVIALALHRKDANLLGLGGDHTSADIIFFVHEDFVRDHGESLSTAEGYADTSVGPIFVAAGAGIKEGFEMTMFPREVDVAPTAAALLGVRMPAQCEGAPVYTILSEEL